MRIVLAMLLVSASALAAPPGATRPVVRPPAATPPMVPQKPLPPPPPPKPALVAIDPDTVPEKCLDLALRAGSPETQLAESARVSLANCIEVEKIKTVAVCDCAQSVQDLDDAVAPAFAILDDLATNGDPSWQVVALHAEADELTVLSQKLLATLPAPSPGAGSDELALHDVRAQMLQPLVQPWQAKVQDKYAAVDRIAKAHPELAKDSVAQTVIADSRRRMTPQVATP